MLVTMGLKVNRRRRMDGAGLLSDAASHGWWVALDVSDQLLYPSVRLQIRTLNPAHSPASSARAVDVTDKSKAVAPQATPRSRDDALMAPLWYGDSLSLE